MKRKAVIVLGLRGDEDEVGVVERLGYRVLFFATQISLEQALRVDVPVEMALNDEDAAVAQAVDLGQRFDIGAVYTLHEYRVPLAARMAEALGLPYGLSYEAALNCRNKIRTRRLLACHGVGSASFTTVRTPCDIPAALERIPLPVVVKPANDAGSHLVTRCETSQAVYEATDEILTSPENWVGQAMDRQVLVEEYLDGPEYSVEACTAAGKTTVLAITAKRLSPPPFATEAGHTVPAPLSADDSCAMQQLVIDALAAVGVSDTVTHTEVKLTSRGPRVVEINARPGGDRIPELVRAVTGYDLAELSLHLALGHSLADAPRHPILAPSAAIRFLVVDEDGVLVDDGACGASDITGLQLLHLYVDKGDPVERTTCNFNRLGYVIVHGTDAQSADVLADRALRDLSVRVEAPALAVVGG
jgi:biotin carboxylase